MFSQGAALLLAICRMLHGVNMVKTAQIPEVPEKNQKVTKKMENPLRRQTKKMSKSGNMYVITN